MKPFVTSPEMHPQFHICTCHTHTPLHTCTYMHACHTHTHTHTHTQTDKGKKHSKMMLLSRLKNRNKTAPAPQSPGSSPQTRAPLPSVLQGQAATKNTWVTPEPASESGGPEVPRPLPEGPTSFQEGPTPLLEGSSPLEGLPEMPRVRHMLPPIKGVQL